MDERKENWVDEEPSGRPSRTARKNASEALQKLGEELIALRAPVLAGLELPERLAEAIVAARRLKDHGGRRRQLQFIGKLMRNLEPEELDAIEATLDQELPGRRSPRG